MDWNWVAIVSTVISALATVVIACYARQSKQSQDKFQEQLSDLYQAMVIATLQSANTDETRVRGFITEFKKLYKGKTSIFKE